MSYELPYYDGVETDRHVAAGNLHLSLATHPGYAPVKNDGMKDMYTSLGSDRTQHHQIGKATLVTEIPALYPARRGEDVIMQGKNVNNMRSARRRGRQSVKPYNMNTI